MVSSTASGGRSRIWASSPICASVGAVRSSQKNWPLAHSSRIRSASKWSRTCIRRRDGSRGAGCHALLGRGSRGALGRLEHAGAVLVAALVLAHAPDRRLVGVTQGRADLLDVLVVVAGPRLVLGERLDALQDGRAGVVGALVRRHRGELLLRQPAQALDELGRVQVVVARDRRLGGGIARAAGGARARRAGAAGARAGARARP